MVKRRKTLLLLSGTALISLLAGTGGVILLLCNLGKIAKAAGAPREIAQAFDQLRSASISVPAWILLACGLLLFGAAAGYRALWNTKRTLALWLLPLALLFLPLMALGGFLLAVWFTRVNHVRAGTAFRILFQWVRTGALK